jgi:putative transposase
MNVSDAQRLKALEAENGKLKRLLDNSMLELDAMAEVLHLLQAMLVDARARD